MHAYCEKEKKKSTHLSPLGGRKNGHKIFCQARIFFFFVTNALLFGVANLI